MTNQEKGISPRGLLKSLLHPETGRLQMPLAGTGGGLCPGRRRPPWHRGLAWPRERHHLTVACPTLCLQVPAGGGREGPWGWLPCSREGPSGWGSCPPALQLLAELWSTAASPMHLESVALRCQTSAEWIYWPFIFCLSWV